MKNKTISPSKRQELQLAFANVMAYMDDVAETRDFDPCLAKLWFALENFADTMGCGFPDIFVGKIPKWMVPVEPSPSYTRALETMQIDAEWQH